MSRQHSLPILLDATGAQTVTSLPLGSGPDQISEADLQQLIHAFPACLPIREIDPLFADPVPMCMELPTAAGPIDNFMLTASGLPVLVECKLWRNPQGRREVVGQILDYAKELTRWTSSDVHREVAQRSGLGSNPMLAKLRESGHEIDEVAFNDALTLNLRRGRFLLLIVGDGIREGVEAIAEYLQRHANLHFTLGLVEMPVFELADGRRLVTPRVLARTHLIERQVVTVPEGMILLDANVEAEAGPSAEDDNDPNSRVNFWRSFVAGLKLDDPEQPPPNVTRNGWITLSLPVKGGTAWVTIWRNEPKHTVGIYLSHTRDSLGARVVERMLADWPEINTELGPTTTLLTDKLGRSLISDEYSTGNWAKAEEREKAFVWLRKRTNDFVNVLRPRIKSVVADIERES